jgi:riboflavin synthase
MFTGLIEELGRIDWIEERGADRRMWIGATRVLEGAKVGDSINCDGCCLTAIAIEPRRFAVETVPETLARTTLGGRRAGDPLNLERALALGERMGGHLVQGHVDGVGEVRSFEPEGEGRRLSLAVPEALRRFVAEKGSLAVDGVSLTVARLTAEGCEIAYIPHTLTATTAGAYTKGRAVNLEVDLIARYIARLLDATGVMGRST